MEDLIGKQFGPYRVVEKIGEGGMAVVYKAHQESLGRYAAIKVLRAELARDEEFVNRFRREALAVANLHHPNILTVYDAGAAHGVYYMAMGFIEGGSLKDLMLHGPLDAQYAAAITSQLADALDYAHRQGIIHRDVKPSNVLITSDGRPMLTDFGIAKAMYESAALTRTGATIGTPEYMAPEQIQGQPVDGRADIYALGIVLYEMLTGWAPFSAPTPVATLYKQVNEPAPPIHQLNVNVPEWLEVVVSRALTKRPEARYQQASEFAEALRQGPAQRATGAAAVAPPPVPGTIPARGATPPPGGRPAVTPPPGRGSAPTPPPGRDATPVPAELVTPAGAVPVSAAALPPRAKRRLAVPVLLGAIVILALALAGAAAVMFLGGDKGSKGAIGPEGTTLVVTSPAQDVVTVVVTNAPEDVVTMVVTSPPGDATPSLADNSGANTTATAESRVAANAAATTQAMLAQTPTPAPTAVPIVVPSDTPVPPTNTPAPPAPTRTAAPPPARSKLLLFTSTQSSDNDLYTVDEKGANRKRLTKFGRVGGAQFSPDGRRIVFSRVMRDQPYNTDIYVMNTDGTGQQNITNTNDWVELDPDWSPDGKRIAFRGGPAGQKYSQIWVMNTDGSGRAQLADPNNMNQSPIWSPDGKKIAFVSWWSGQGGYWQDKGDVFVVNANGSGLTNLTNRGEGFTSPVWSPNGAEFVYGRLTRDPGTGEYWQVWRMNANGSNQRCIVGCQEPYSKWSNVPAAWRGSRIYFGGWEKGNWDLYLANADGTKVVKVTNESYDEKTRDWQP